MSQETIKSSINEKIVQPGCQDRNFTANLHGQKHLNSFSGKKNTHNPAKQTAFVQFHTQTAETSIFTTNPACSLVFLNWIINKHHQYSIHAFAKIIIFKQTPILIPGHVEVKESHREISIPKCSLSNRIRALKSSSNRVTGD